MSPHHEPPHSRVSGRGVADLIVAELVRYDFLRFVLDTEQSQDDIDFGDRDCSHRRALYKERNE